MFIRPATIPEGMEGAGTRYRVRDPVTHHFLKVDGEEKPDTDYWLRRLVEGGVEEIKAPEFDDAVEDALEAKPKGDVP